MPSAPAAGTARALPRRPPACAAPSAAASSRSAGETPTSPEPAPARSHALWCWAISVVCSARELHTSAMSNEDFAYSAAPEPHRARTQEILRQHPEIRELIGPNPVTFLWTAGIVAAQLGVAWLVSAQPWWVIVAAAYTVGAVGNHALFVMIHECAHRLVFKRKVPNQLTAILANFPQFFPGGISFAKYHLKHHVFQGVYELDADLPNRWEARLVGHSALGKALWLLFYPVV